jgi:hypothetical protein
LLLHASTRAQELAAVEWDAAQNPLAAPRGSLQRKLVTGKLQPDHVKIAS